MVYRGIEIDSKSKNFRKEIETIDNYWNNYYIRKKRKDDLLYIFSQKGVR